MQLSRVIQKTNLNHMEDIYDNGKMELSSNSGQYSVHQQFGRLRFNPRPSHTKNTQCVWGLSLSLQRQTAL